MEKVNLTNLECAFVVIFKELNFTKQEVIGIMLMLKDKPKKQKELFDYIRNSNPKNLTPRIIIDKTLELIDDE